MRRRAGKVGDGHRFAQAGSCQTERKVMIDGRSFRFSLGRWRGPPAVPIHTNFSVRVLGYR